MSGGLATSLVVFDLDGTLVDSARDLASAVNATLARVAPRALALDAERVKGFIGDGAGQLVSRSLQAAGLALPVDEVLPVFVECYRARLLDTTRLYPGVREALDALAGRALAVLTNKPGDLSRAILAGLHVADRFARIWGGGDVPARKPDPAGLLKLMTELGAAPERSVLVGDSGIDVRTARAASVRCIGVSYGLAPRSLDADPPDVLIDDLRQLLGLLG
jgi:phosphoglycolate phosphatase